MIYRNDIDGLRAIAVLAVIFYHLGFTFIPGGFVGVDIFFVISGFLITQTIQKDIDENRFTITHFYVKRIRRILPALFVITSTTIFFSLLILPLNEIHEFSKSIVSVSTFTSNIFFWRYTDYFSVAAELKPLLHTWSLGIEEQFYILFPIFMLVTHKIIDKKILFWIFLFLLVSFLVSVSPLGMNHPVANFFLPITRFWELFMGSALAVGMKYINSGNKTINNFSAFLGLLLILLPMILLDQNSTFPGINALFPVLGASLIIYSASEKRTFLSSFLSNKYVRYIGLISFSLYLWHWPIIALTKNIIIGDFTINMQLSIIILTFVLSMITYKYVEQPFRKTEKLKKFLNIKIGVVALLILAIVGSIIFMFMQLNFPKQEVPHINTSCFKNKETLESTKRCSFGDKDSNKIFLLYGDSHSGAMYPAFEKLALENGWRGIPASFSGCAPLFDVFRLDGIGNASNCTGEYSKNVEKFLEENNKDIAIVYLVARWTLFEKGWIKNGRLQKATHFLSDNKIKSKNSTDSSKVLKKGIINTVNKISKEFKIQTIILAPVPVLHASINSHPKDVTKVEYQNQRYFVDSIFSTFKNNLGVSIIDPIDVFCPIDTCHMNKNDKALYIDDNHVSIFGSLLLYPLLESTLKGSKLK